MLKPTTFTNDEACLVSHAVSELMDNVLDKMQEAV